MFIYLFHVAIDQMTSMSLHFGAESKVLFGIHTHSFYDLTYDEIEISNNE